MQCVGIAKKLNGNVGSGKTHASANGTSDTYGVAGFKFREWHKRETIIKVGIKASKLVECLEQYSELHEKNKGVEGWNEWPCHLQDS